MLEPKNQDEKLVKIVIGISITLIIIAGFSPFLFTRSISNISFSETGQIGDTIGGITSPILAVLGAILTFFAFYIQYRANKYQLKNIN